MPSCAFVPTLSKGNQSVRCSTWLPWLCGNPLWASCSTAEEMKGGRIYQQVAKGPCTLPFLIILIPDHVGGEPKNRTTHCHSTSPNPAASVSEATSARRIYLRADKPDWTGCPKLLRNRRNRRPIALESRIAVLLSIKLPKQKGIRGSISSMYKVLFPFFSPFPSPFLFLFLLCNVRNIQS